MSEINSRKNNRNKLFNIFFFIIFMSDYIFTYVGINHYHIIAERNPFLVNFFNMPFPKSLAIRLIFAFIIMSSLRYLCLHKSKYYKPLAWLSLALYTMVNIMHIRWIVFIIMINFES